MIVVTKEPVKAALNYAENGFPVFPVCWPNSEGKCGCGRNHEEKSVGKVPLTKNGLKDATTDPTRISNFWKVHPGANIGIAIPQGYFVLDIDIGHNGYESLSKLQEQVGQLPSTLLVTTGSGGAHYWFTTDTEIRNTVKLAGLEGIDVRGVGGYVVAAPSKHRVGQRYEISENNKIAPAPKELIDLILKATPVATTPSITGDTISEGGRNHTLASLGGTMRHRGMSQQEIEVSLLAINQGRCVPPLPEENVRRIALSVSRYEPKAIPSQSGTNVTQNVTDNVTLSFQIDQWVEETKGRWFETQELDRELGIFTPVGKNNRRGHMIRLEEKRTIIRHPKQNKSWRFITSDLKMLDYKSIPTAVQLPIILPLGLNRLVKLFPPSLIVIAGTQNAGKTALVMEIMRLNNDSKMPINYFYSEGGGAELNNRLSDCESMAMEEWNFNAFSRSTNFADVIIPDCINIVDYLEITSDFYDVGTLLGEMYGEEGIRVGNGCLIVCLQKSKNKEFGRGGDLGNEKARLYITLGVDDGSRMCKAKIVKGKAWAQKNYNPNGLECSFNVNNGWIVNNEVEWKLPSEFTR